jgi:hypothetical protein
MQVCLQSMTQSVTPHVESVEAKSDSSLNLLADLSALQKQSDPALGGASPGQGVASLPADRPPGSVSSSDHLRIAAPGEASAALSASGAGKESGAQLVSSQSAPAVSSVGHRAGVAESPFLMVPDESFRDAYMSLQLEDRPFICDVLGLFTVDHRCSFGRTFFSRDAFPSEVFIRSIKPFRLPVKQDMSAVWAYNTDKHKLRALFRWFADARRLNQVCSPNSELWTPVFQERMKEFWSQHCSSLLVRVAYNVFTPGRAAPDPSKEDMYDKLLDRQVAPIPSFALRAYFEVFNGTLGSTMSRARGLSEYQPVSNAISPPMLRTEPVEGKGLLTARGVTFPLPMEQRTLSEGALTPPTLTTLLDRVVRSLEFLSDRRDHETTGPKRDVFKSALGDIVKRINGAYYVDPIKLCVKERERLKSLTAGRLSGASRRFNVGPGVSIAIGGKSGQDWEDETAESNNWIDCKEGLTFIANTWLEDETMCKYVRDFMSWQLLVAEVKDCGPESRTLYVKNFLYKYLLGGELSLPCLGNMVDLFAKDTVLFVTHLSPSVPRAGLSRRHTERFEPYAHTGGRSNYGEQRHASGHRGDTRSYSSSQYQRDTPKVQAVSELPCVSRYVKTHGVCRYTPCKFSHACLCCGADHLPSECMKWSQDVADAAHDTIKDRRAAAKGKGSGTHRGGGVSDTSRGKGGKGGSSSGYGGRY